MLSIHFNIIRTNIIFKYMLTLIKDHMSVDMWILQVIKNRISFNTLHDSTRSNLIARIAGLNMQILRLHLKTPGIIQMELILRGYKSVPKPSRYLEL